MITLDTARFAVVHFCVFLLVIIQGFHWGNGTFLLLGLMALYYWCVHRPTLMPIWSWAIYGLLLDSISGMPLGITALFFIMSDLVIKSQRLLLLSQPYIVFWLGFAVLGLFYELWRWGVFAILTASLPPLQDGTINVVLSIILFPLINIILITTHRLLPLSQSRS